MSSVRMMMIDLVAAAWRAVAVSFVVVATIQVYLALIMSVWWPWLVALPLAVAAALSWYVAVSDDADGGR